MADKAQEVYVFFDQEGGTPSFLGTLFVSNVRGRGTCAFSYEDPWLQQHKAGIMLDPDLPYYRGRQYIPTGKPIFGMLSDSCPDRWGRTLMDCRELISARKENRKPRKLTEIDYLLGVYDQSRMGALRVALNPGGPFLACDQALAAPPWTTLRQLETASIAFEQDESGEAEKWLNQLLAPGSSLGGARPKACVQDPRGDLWIAKFPSKHDSWDAGKWEMIVHDLAVECGLNVPKAMCVQFSDLGSTFLTKRFDRAGTARIHFASAMTLLGKTDGDSGTSYLELAGFLKANGAAPQEDLLELWKRIVFSMAVSNTDDHLRNHGFLLTDKGWRLSPLYDVNPSIYGDALSLNVTEYDSTIDYSLAAETAPYYGISRQEADIFIREIAETVQKRWQVIAKKYGASRSAMAHMGPAFAGGSR